METLTTHKSRTASVTGWAGHRLYRLTLAVAGIIQLCTISFAPYLHLDEFMIIDLGRIVMDPKTDWSIAWLPGADQPVFFWFYLGSVTQELIFRLAGEFGPRIFALAGALTGARIMLSYLLLRGTRRVPAAVLSVVFLLDPLFVQSYTMGRLDSWTLACGLLSCVLLRQVSVRKQQLRRPAYGKMALAGSVMTIGWLIWPSSVFLLPLILVELRTGALTFRTLQQRISATGFFVLGCLVTGLILLLPLAPVVTEQLQNLADGITTNTRSGSAGHPFSVTYWAAQVLELFRILKFTPVLAVIAFLICLRTHRKDVFFAMAAAAGIMIFTVVYIHRVQYLLPYFIVLAAELYSPSRRPIARARKNRNRIRFAGLALLLLWGAGMSVIVRTVLAVAHRQERDRELVTRAAESMIGAGPHGVLMPGEFYYAGRKLGWKMYKPYLAQNEPMTPESLERVLPHLEYVIWTGESLPAVFIRTLTANGLHQQGRLRIYARKPGGTRSWTDGVRNLFSIQRQPYGPYIIYSRTRRPAPEHNR